jgi:protein Mpv17
VLFSLVMAGLKGASWEQAVQIAREDFWGLVMAGWRLWPLVSAINYTFVRTVGMRALVGNLAGVGWSVYLSLVMGS